MKPYDEFKDELLQRKEQRIVTRRNRRARIITSFVCLVLCIGVLIAAMIPGNSPIIPTVQAADLMANIQANNVSGKKADDAFITGQTEFSIKLFQSCFKETPEGNTLISPLSVMLALAMTANGADGQTKAEMEAVLGMPIEELNRYLYSYANSLATTENAKVGIANSVWYRDSEYLHVKDTFLQTVADYYGSDAYKAPFDSQTVKDINGWVSHNTDGMIDQITDEIKEETVMYLINALVFDAKWELPYSDTSLEDGIFTTEDGVKQDVTMMYGKEYRYLADPRATGFIKYYKGNQYAFVALLPNEGISVEDYVNSLDAETLQNTLQNACGTVNTAMPKFSYDYELTLNDTLSALGMPTAFDGDYADFGPMVTSDRGNIYIGEVIHKTHISVDNEGTRAAAVTVVEISEATIAPSFVYNVTLDRPFVYMIIDTSTNLPLFMGTVMSIEN